MHVGIAWITAPSPCGLCAPHQQVQLLHQLPHRAPPDAAPPAMVELGVLRVEVKQGRPFGSGVPG